MCHPSALGQLLRFGGFPEPLLAANERELRRWQREQRDRLSHLPRCVGSPLSVKSLSSLLQVAFETAEHWVAVLERLYVCFRVAPFGSPRIRAVKKERKLYFWDWSHVPDEGPRFENLVACQLLKYCHWREDVDGHAMELRYLRDTDGREVDFVVLCDGAPEFAVECKTGESRPSAAAGYFQRRTPIPVFYQVHLGRTDRKERDGLRILPLSCLCRELGLP